DRHFRATLVERLPLEQIEVVEFNVDDARRLHGATEVLEVLPILLIDPVIDLLRRDDVDSLDVLLQKLAHVGANGSRGAGIAELMRRRRPTENDDALVLERSAFCRNRVAAVPHVNAG